MFWFGAWPSLHKTSFYLIGPHTQSFMQPLESFMNCPGNEEGKIKILVGSVWFNSATLQDDGIENGPVMCVFAGHRNQWHFFISNSYVNTFFCVQSTFQCCLCNVTVWHFVEFCMQLLKKQNGPPPNSCKIIWTYKWCFYKISLFTFV